MLLWAFFGIFVLNFDSKKQKECWHISTPTLLKLQHSNRFAVGKTLWFYYSVTFLFCQQRLHRNYSKQYQKCEQRQNCYYQKTQPQFTCEIEVIRMFLKMSTHYIPNFIKHFWMTAYQK